jgi:hypothetical protein
LRALQRTQNTHTLVQKDYLRRSRNVYVGIAPTVYIALPHRPAPTRVDGACVIIILYYKYRFLNERRKEIRRVYGSSGTCPGREK